MNVHAVLTFLV